MITTILPNRHFDRNRLVSFDSFLISFEGVIFERAKLDVFTFKNAFGSILIFVRSCILKCQSVRGASPPAEGGDFLRIPPRFSRGMHPSFIIEVKIKFHLKMQMGNVLMLVLVGLNS